LVGRAYGGGILKLEPGEAVHLPLPSPALVRKNEDQLLALIPKLRQLLDSGRLREAVAEVDALLLRHSRAVKASELAGLREAREHLASRRASRSSIGSRSS
jgi:hypothetical protein